MNDMHHVDHPDDERYDSIAIFVVERWKESELSGDEWRFSWVAHFKRKGETVVKVSANSLRWLLAGLEWRAMIAGEEDEIDREAWNRTKDKCDQPGCPEVATLFYKRLKRYTKQGDELAPSLYHDGHEYRQFCARHRVRGDCGLDDADHNYHVILDPNM
jgi:hypothetical protein